MFLLLWWVLDSPEEPEPWLPAGVIAALLFTIFTFYRELILRPRSVRNKPKSVRTDDHWRKSSRAKLGGNSRNSARKNNSIIQDIELKSAAARTLGIVAEAHLEVFEICEDYLRLIRLELDGMADDSARSNALWKGKKRIEEIHKYHLLQWASIESKVFTKNAQETEEPDERAEASGKALLVLESALHFYPEDPQLNESIALVREMVLTNKLTLLLEKAENAEKSKNLKKALEFYREALHSLARNDVKSNASNELGRKISSKIEYIRHNI
ncbi:MAG: hypothetical protein ACK5NT_13525 [Pyrinomonadaceae bacterium]